MDSLTAARTLIGHSLAVHIVIVAFSIGLPVLMSLFEWWAWRKNDQNLRSFVNLLARWSAVFVIGGVFTGTIIALQFSTLWAPYLEATRPYVGKMFQLEGYMFLIEAAFLAWYLATMKNVGTLKHFLIGIPISIGTIGSAFFITIVNAWMNNPSAIFTSTTVNEILHSVFSYIFATAFIVLGFIAWRSLRKQSPIAKKRLNFLLSRLTIISGILLLVLAVLGHQSAVDIAHTQPHKLAAIEMLEHSQTNAPIRVGGVLNENGSPEGGVVLPGMLSLLAGFTTDYEVKGYSGYPLDRSLIVLVHYLFDIKMMLVGACVGVIGLGIFFIWKRQPTPRWLRMIFVPAGLLGFILVEIGWFITELGRQPWAIVGKQSTADALTKGASLPWSVPVFVLLAFILTAATLSALYFVTKDWRKAEKSTW